MRMRYHDELKGGGCAYEGKVPLHLAGSLKKGERERRKEKGKREPSQHRSKLPLFLTYKGT